MSDNFDKPHDAPMTGWVECPTGYFFTNGELFRGDMERIASIPIAQVGDTITAIFADGDMSYYLNEKRVFPPLSPKEIRRRRYARQYMRRARG